MFDSTLDSALIQWRYCVSRFSVYSINPQSLHVSAQTLLTTWDPPGTAGLCPVADESPSWPAQAMKRRWADLLPAASALTHTALHRTRTPRTWRLLMPRKSGSPHPQCHTGTGRAEPSAAASLQLCGAGTGFVGWFLQWKRNTVRGHWQSS